MLDCSSELAPAKLRLDKDRAIVEVKGMIERRAAALQAKAMMTAEETQCRFQRYY